MCQLHPPSDLCEGSAADLCGKMSQINGAVHLVHPAAACLCSSHPFSLSFWPLPGSCQCLICIVHHGTQQPDCAHLMNRHHHWRWDRLQVFGLLSLPQVFGDSNSILHFLQAAPEVTVNYQVTLSATSHCVEPVVQLVLDQDCWPHLFIMFFSSFLHISYSPGTLHTPIATYRLKWLFEIVQLKSWSASRYLWTCQGSASCTGFAVLSLLLCGNESTFSILQQGTQWGICLGIRKHTKFGRSLVGTHLIGTLFLA